MKPDDKLVLMGHNRHLSMDIGSIQTLGGSPPGGGLVPSLGTYLNRRLPGQVFSIWMLHESGYSAQPFSGLASEYTVRPGSLNAALSRVGERFLLSTQAQVPEANLLHKKTDIVGLYNVPFRTAIANQADAVYFVREVSPIGL
jgi:erythromycin esterase-like protein